MLTFNPHHHTRHSNCIVTLSSPRPPPPALHPNLYSLGKKAGGRVGWTRHVRKAAAAGARCRGPRACAVQSVWPLKTLGPNPIRERKGRHAKAQLGLSDRLTPLADYWIWWSDGRQRWMSPYVAQAAYTCHFAAGVSTESRVLVNMITSCESETMLMNHKWSGQDCTWILSNWVFLYWLYDPFPVF